MVALILAFIFFTPRAMFRDQPRASSVVMLPSEQGVAQFWVEPDLLVNLDESQRLERANQLLRSRTGKLHKVTRLEPIFDSEQEVRSATGRDAQFPSQLRTNNQLCFWRGVA